VTGLFRIFERTGTYWIFRLSWIDFIRRKDIYVISACMGLFVIGAVTIRFLGVPNRSTALFLMSSGFTLAGVLGIILAASFASRTFPEELERKTLIPLLAKPVSHGSVLWGKYLACVSLSGLPYLLFVGAVLLAVPMVSGQTAVALAQVVVLQFCGLALVSAICLSVSLFFPFIIAALVTLLWYFGSGPVLHVGRQALMCRVLPEWQTILERLIACVPDASLLQQIESFAGALGPLPPSLFGGLVVYGLSWVCLFLVIAHWRLRCQWF